MNTSYVGIHAFLTRTPLWVTVLILYLMTDGAMHIGREYFEGLAYQVAYSAKFGDAALLGVVFIATTILQRGNVVLPKLLTKVWMHRAIVLVGICLGSAVSWLTLPARSGQIMDIYHDVVIAPMILYFAVTLLPVIYLAGKRAEKVSTVCFILFWLALVVYDTGSNRMNQRNWLEKHLGVHLVQCSVLY